VDGDAQASKNREKADILGIMRDDFTEEVKRTLAARVGNHCSNPNCRALTSGPQDNPTKALNVGVAAHITAAAQGGARYDAALSSEQRCHPDNGIWLCQNCAKLVDNDPSQFPANLLRDWKIIAEHYARSTIGKTALPESLQRQPGTSNSSAVRFPLLKHRHNFGHLGGSHNFFPTDFLQGVLVDSPAHQFPLGNLCDPQ
jgi:hypothetical protein